MKKPVKKVAKKAAATTKKTTPKKKATVKKAAVKKAGAKKAKTKRAPARRAQKRVAAPEPVAPSVSISQEVMMQELAGEDAALEREAAREERQREVAARLAVSCNRYDDLPNLELAADIVFNMDRGAVDALVDLLETRDDVHGPDAGKVLAEVGKREPDLIVHQVPRLVSFIDWENEDMLPSVMCALSPMGHTVVDELWEYRDLFWNYVGDGQDEADTAQESAVRLLAALCAAGPDYARTLAGGLVDLLGKCLPRDVALFAEAVLPALGSSHSHRAKPVLDRRMKELMPAEVARLRRAVRTAQNGAGGYRAAA